MTSKKKNILQKMIGLALLSVSAIIIAFAAFEYNNYKQTINKAYSESESLHYLVIERIEKMGKISTVIFNSFEERLLRQGIKAFLGPTETWGWFSLLAEGLPEHASLWFIDAGGELKFGSTTSEPLSGNFSDRRYFKEHQNGAKFFIGPSIKGRITNSYQFTFSQRIDDHTGKFVGVILATVEFSSLENLIEMIPNSNGSVVALYKGDSSLVFRQNMSDHMLDFDAKNGNLFTKHLRESRTGKFRAHSDADSVDRIVSYSYLPELDIVVLAGISAKTALAGWYQYLLTHISIIIFVIILILYLFFISIRHATDQEKLATLRSQIITTVSHELRTPMNAIIGYTDLAKTETSPALLERYHHAITSASEVMLDLINDILDFASIEKGTLKISPANFSLRELVHDLQNVIHPTAEKKRITFIVKEFSTVPNFLVGDRKRIFQILLNLIGNGIKFTEKGVVTLEILVIKDFDHETTLRFNVSDTGIGIRESDLKSLFQAFSQIDGTLTRNYPGTGLGLKICQELAKLMKGDILVQSEYGKGSIFSFEIPLTKQKIKGFEYV